jgi:hypothetical protein
MQALAASCEDLRARTGNPPLEDAQCFNSISESSSGIEKLVSYYSDTGVVKTRNAGISRNMAEYDGIFQNITEYGGITQNITTFSRNIPEHHNIFRW